MKEGHVEVAEPVRYCVVDDLAVLLDLRVGKYHIFDKAGSILWQYIMNPPEAQPDIQSVASQLRLSPGHVQAELEHFVEDCAAKGLITWNQAPPLRRAIPNKYTSFVIPRWFPATIIALYCIGSTRRALSRSGFAALYRDLLRMNLPNRHAEMPLIRSALASFRCAENFFSVQNARIDCLPRSLALYRFMRLLGFQVTHCIGVRRFPFGAHAWIELDGETLSDSVDFIRQFTVISRL